MPKYQVTLPFAGYVYVEIEAADEKGAKEAAFEIAPDHASFKMTGPVEIGEWEFFEHITQGNVSYAPRNSIEVEEIEPGEDDAA